MIERLPTHDRVYIATRHRRLSGAMILLTVGLAIYILIHVAAFAAGDRASVALETGLQWAGWIVQIALLIPMFAVIGYSIYLSVRLIENNFLAVLAAIACLHVIFAMVAATIICIRLRNDWRRHGIDATWRGVTPEAMFLLSDIKYCGGCGYDLQGNVSGVCPECGKALVAMPS